MRIFLRWTITLLIISVPVISKANFKDSLQAISTLPDDTGKVTALNNLALWVSAENSDSAIIISNQALKLAQGIKWDFGIAKSLHFLGMFYGNKAENKRSLDYSLGALDLWKQQELTATDQNKNLILQSKSRTLGHIAINYMDMGNYPRALDYYFEALKISEATRDSVMIATTLGNIGIVYTEQGYTEKALDYYFKALKVDEELDNKSGISINLGNIGTVYSDAGEYAKALGFYLRALPLEEEFGEKDGVALLLGNIGLVYESEKEYEKALEYYFKALAIGKEGGNATTVAVQLRAIGTLYSEMGKYKEAENYLLQALAMDENSEALAQIKDDELALSVLYSQTGRHALALDHFKKYAAAKDSLYNEENAEKFVRSEMNYEFEKKEANQKAEHDKAVIALEAENRIAKTARNFIIALAIMLVGLISFGFTWFNNRKNLRVKEHFSQQLILSQEKERQRISKELHDSIGQNMLFIKNQLIKQNDTALLVSVNETLEEVRNISKDLYPNQLERYGLAAAVDALAEKVTETSSIFVSHDLEAFSKEISSDKQINYYRIIQECITNTLKHSEATALRITASAADGMIELIVQDNGKGFDKLILAKKAQHSFGMLNTEERVHYLQGRFDVQTSPGNGTKYTFNLPV